MAEKQVLGGRSEEGNAWSGLHLPCNIHIIAGAFKKSFQLMDSDVSGMINVALYLSMGPNMFLFRQTLTQLVASKLQIVRGTPTPEMHMYREHMLNLFCSAGRGLALKRFLLSKLPNGDWRRKDIIEVFIPPGLDFAREQVLDNVCTALVLSLAGSLFSVYPRHRWLGADTTVEQVGLCEAVNGLLSSTLHSMMQSTTASSSQLEVPESAEFTDLPFDPSVTVPEEIMPGEKTGGAPGQVPSEVGLQPEAEATLQAPPAHETGQPEDWQGLAALNAQQRQKAAACMQTSPLPRLMVMRAAMRPLAQLLQGHLLRGSEAWENEQRASIATAALSGADEDCPRQAVLLEYVCLTSERRFMEELANLRQAHMWRHFEEDQHTRAFQTMIFRLLSRMGCLVQELLIAPTSRFPLQIFQVVEGGREVAARL